MIKKLSTLSGITDIRTSAPNSASIENYDIFQVSISGTPGYPFSSDGWTSTSLTYSQMTENLSASLEDATDCRFFTLSSDGTNPPGGDARVTVGNVNEHGIQIKTVGDALTLVGDDSGSVIILSGTDKYAIVPSKDGEFVSLACTEMPETRFEDVYTAHVKGLSRAPALSEFDFTIEIDPEFMFVCAEGTIEAISVVSDLPAMLGADVVDDKIFVSGVCGGQGTPNKITVKISGIRKGREGQRFVKMTQEQYDKNTEFWSQWNN